MRYGRHGEEEGERLDLEYSSRWIFQFVIHIQLKSGILVALPLIERRETQRGIKKWIIGQVFLKDYSKRLMGFHISRIISHHNFNHFNWSSKDRIYEMIYILECLNTFPIRGCCYIGGNGVWELAVVSNSPDMVSLCHHQPQKLIIAPK